jgi:hypothetical protein
MIVEPIVMFSDHPLVCVYRTIAEPIVMFSDHSCRISDALISAADSRGARALGHRVRRGDEWAWGGASIFDLDSLARQPGLHVRPPGMRVRARRLGAGPGTSSARASESRPGAGPGRAPVRRSGTAPPPVKRERFSGGGARQRARLVCRPPPIRVHHPSRACGPDRPAWRHWWDDSCHLDPQQSGSSPGAPSPSVTGRQARPSDANVPGPDRCPRRCGRTMRSRALGPTRPNVGSWFFCRQERCLHARSDATVRSTWYRSVLPTTTVHYIMKPPLVAGSSRLPCLKGASALALHSASERTSARTELKLKPSAVEEYSGTPNREQRYQRPLLRVSLSRSVSLGSPSFLKRNIISPIPSEFEKKEKQFTQVNILQRTRKRRNNHSKTGAVNCCTASC